VAALIYLDTHVVAWLYAQGAEAVPPGVAERLEASDDIRIAPMVRLELQYLYEIDRVAQPPSPVIDALGATLGLTLCRAAFPAVELEAETHTWTRDPFDRLIVAHAALFDARLVTKDESIHAHYPRAMWE